jgi:high-affinity Fe2+/Pb2+ permease
MQPQIQQIVKGTGDATAYGVVVGTLMGWLPAIAAGFTIVWLGMQMLEKFTGQSFNELVRCAWRKIRG